jgi:hypothetical protein
MCTLLVHPHHPKGIIIMLCFYTEDEDIAFVDEYVQGFRDEEDPVTSLRMLDAIRCSIDPATLRTWAKIVADDPRYEGTS